MKTTQIAIGLTSGLILLLVGGALVSEWTLNQALLARNASLQGDLGSLHQALADRESQLKNLQDELASTRKQSNDLEARVNRLEQERKAATNAAPTKAPAPYSLPVYVGERYLGDAWVVPTRVQQDPDTGQYRFRPELRFSPDLKRQLALRGESGAEPSGARPPVYPATAAYNSFNSYTFASSIWGQYPLYYRTWPRTYAHSLRPLRSRVHRPVIRTVPAGGPGGAWSVPAGTPVVTHRPDRRGNQRIDNGIIIRP